MNEVITRLNSDHKCFVRAMAEIDRGLNRHLAGKPSAPQNFSRIIDLFTYIQGYPERWHHPIEDVAFNLLLKMDIPCASDIVRLMHEHELMEEQSQYLRRRFEDILLRKIATDQTIVRDFHRYINRQLEHQRLEEENIFPLMVTLFKTADWRNLERRLLAIPSDDLLKRHYQYLYTSSLQEPATLSAEHLHVNRL